MLMTDAQLGKLVHAAFEELGFAETIRERLQTAVATVIADGPRSSGVRAAIVAADELATALVARRREVGRESTSGPGGSRVRQTATSAADVERRANAFRVMAGVGL
jgi:hypothetical protein